jgi:hypothetical protein
MSPPPRNLILSTWVLHCGALLNFGCTFIGAIALVSLKPLPVRLTPEKRHGVALGIPTAVTAYKLYEMRTMFHAVLRTARNIKRIASEVGSLPREIEESY